MNAPQTKPADDARLRSAYFGLEPDIRDLRHMAAIAWTLFQETIKSSESASEWLTLQISKDELEQLEFAVSRTMRMASNLDEIYLKKFEEPSADHVLAAS